MGWNEDLARVVEKLEVNSRHGTEAITRFKAEIEFATELAEARPETDGRRLIIEAVTAVNESLEAGCSPEKAVARGEAVLSPLGKIAKQYTIHCVGHAHIDMNWMWSWPETVAITNDTFLTVDRLMREFPAFRFSQSQASVYQILQDYLPGLEPRVKERIREGRWEVTATHWVEGDKNLASGEILCRHLLYTKRFFARHYGLDYGAVKIGWEPDTFGHARTIPTILRHAGVTRYYFCRGGLGPQLFWWEGKDGSCILAFDDRRQWYLGPITPAIARDLPAFERETGLRDYLVVYGVGNHGGGPTRRDLRAIQEMDSWPIFPNVRFSTTDAFFAVAEAEAKDLPIIKSELNTVFEGCYTSQSNIKRANRRSEHALVEAETAALLGWRLAGTAYPADSLNLAWRYAMLNQFHDILPGSGVKATYQHAQGLYQEILARTTAAKTDALRAVAGMVDTLSCISNLSGLTASGGATENGLGGGAGDLPVEGAVTRRGTGTMEVEPFVVFNPCPWVRTEVVTTRIWNRDWTEGRIVVHDDAGGVLPVQVLQRGHYWGHDYIEIAFPAREVPATGYRSYVVRHSLEPISPPSGCASDGRGTLENEFYRVVVDPGSGAIVHLVDKTSGVDYVPPGGRLGFLEYYREHPHAMSAWCGGPEAENLPLLEGGLSESFQNGPHLASIRTVHKLRQSKFTLTVSLAVGVPRVDFMIEADWLERGSPETGVPGLRVVFQHGQADPIIACECPYGHVERRMASTGADGPGDRTQPIKPGVDFPAQRWVSVLPASCAGGAPGFTLLNDSKYGFSVLGSSLRMNLIRSSYDPDPLPELGMHTIRFALSPMAGWSPSQAMRAGSAFNLPLNIVGTTLQDGPLPGRAGFAEILTQNAMLGCLKPAEEGGALVVRLCEMEGMDVRAALRLDEALVPGNAVAVQSDLLERPLPDNTARWEKGTLTVDLPAFGLATVRLEAR